MQKENLNCKPIWEFTGEDTLYISDTKSKGHLNNVLHLCKFLWVKNNQVTGVKIDNEGKLVYDSNTRLIEFTAHITKCALYGKHPVTEHTGYSWFLGSGYAIYPQQYELGSENAQVPKSHPSYGLIGISRTTGTTNLFGSSIQHIDYFTLRVATAEHERSLSHDWYHKKKTILELKLSSTQFMDMITGMNRGDGVPCTLYYVNGELMPEPPFISQLDLHAQEFKNKMKAVSEPLEADIQMIKELLSGKTVGKAQKDEIIQILERYSKSMTNSIPFVAKSFGDQTQKTITEAKAAVESFVSSRITEAGIKALQEQAGGQQILLTGYDSLKDEGTIQE